MPIDPKARAVLDAIRVMGTEYIYGTDALPSAKVPLRDIIGDWIEAGCPIDAPILPEADPTDGDSVVVGNGTPGAMEIQPARRMAPRPQPRRLRPRRMGHRARAGDPVCCGPTGALTTGLHMV
jgi:hypothetical protein